MSVLFVAAIVPYLAPIGIAAYRDHPAAKPIFLVNLFLGWTILGWIAALIWACSGEPGRQGVAAAGDDAGPHGLKLQGRDPRQDTLDGVNR